MHARLVNGKATQGPWGYGAGTLKPGLGSHPLTDNQYFTTPSIKPKSFLCETQNITCEEFAQHSTPRVGGPSHQPRVPCSIQNDMHNVSYDTAPASTQKGA